MRANEVSLTGFSRHVHSRAFEFGKVLHGYIEKAGVGPIVSDSISVFCKTIIIEYDMGNVLNTKDPTLRDLNMLKGLPGLAIVGALSSVNNFAPRPHERNVCPLYLSMPTCA
ncbi:hypothetical protein IFM89_021616 [Coptis chinensis]|uniref:Uncharacterized protein n=1 Tax=Coptis chinensis TaxID=261450 RepID=A0A835IBM7_9MAGN|nr:hypothetical protein IFM89_021616 [Coptis chinensis]